MIGDGVVQPEDGRSVDATVRRVVGMATLEVAS